MKTKILLALFFVIAFFIEANAQTKFSRRFWQAPETISASAVAQTSDGGYVMAGSVKDTAAGSLTDVFMAKFSSIGDTIWTNRLGSIGRDAPLSIQQTNDGGYIITGSIDSFGAGY